MYSRLAMLAMLVMSPLTCEASSIALTFTGGNPIASTRTVGWEFTTSDALNVASLGWFDANADGLATSHKIGIWDLAGNLLVSATVASGTTDPLQGLFRYNSTFTVNTTLAAGTSYIIGGQSTTNDGLQISVPLASITTAPEITFVQNSVSGSLGVFTFPNTTAGGFDAGVFGPTFTFNAVQTPEPATGAPFALGATALLLIGYRRRAAKL